MPIQTPKASIKSDLLLIAQDMKTKEYTDEEWAEAMSIIIKAAVDNAFGTGTASAVTPGSGTAPVAI